MQVRTTNIITFSKSVKPEQIVFGEVYKPDEKDTDGNFMSRETIAKMAHDFLSKQRNAQISKGHSGAKDKGCVVEIFIVREGDPDFKAGSWVVGVHVPDVEVWKSIEAGDITGFSIEGQGQLIEEAKKSNEQAE